MDTTETTNALASLGHPRLQNRQNQLSPEAQWMQKHNICGVRSRHRSLPRALWKHLLNVLVDADAPITGPTPSGKLQHLKNIPFSVRVWGHRDTNKKLLRGTACVKLLRIHIRLICWLVALCGMNNRVWIWNRCLLNSLSNSSRKNVNKHAFRVGCRNNLGHLSWGGGGGVAHSLVPQESGAKTQIGIHACLVLIYNNFVSPTSWLILFHLIIYFPSWGTNKLWTFFLNYVDIASFQRELSSSSLEIATSYKSYGQCLI